MPSVRNDCVNNSALSVAFFLVFVLFLAGCTGILDGSTKPQNTVSPKINQNTTSTPSTSNMELIEQQKKAEDERRVREQNLAEANSLENETEQNLDSLGTLIQEAGNAIK
jgi:hypothetical protein